MTTLRGSRIRFLFDTLATIAMIVAAGTMIWVALGNRIVIKGSSASRPESPPPADPVALGVSALQGDPTAPLALVVFSDFQCPFCTTFANEALPKIKQAYVSTGRVIVAFRHFPLTNQHPQAQKAAEAAECAGRQGRFWEMHDTLFLNQLPMDESSLTRRASALGLNIVAFDRCLAGEAALKVQTDFLLGVKLGVSGTPAVLIGFTQPDGSVRMTDRLSGIKTFEEISKVLDHRLRGMAGS